MKYYFLHLLWIVNVAIAEDIDNELPEILAPAGKIRGLIMKSRLGKKIYSFRGVRYAEPPIGDRRFEAPEPVEDWEEIFNATKEGPSCPQLESVCFQSEDCLRLNVYTTKLPAENATDVGQPVMVFFHPGGSYKHSGQSFLFGPQYLLDNEIVLVTVNYRLSILGFISTGDAAAPGNLAFKDQVMALRWVQRNIVAFGGNPLSVTLFGANFGAVSAVLHMLSPMSKGLFHRVIAMSGSPIDKKPYPMNKKCLVEKYAKFFICSNETSKGMIDCLKEQALENLLNVTLDESDNQCSVDYLLQNWLEQPSFLWSPVVEPEIDGVQRFLEDQPIALILERKIHNVPLITGVTKDELAGLVIPLLENSSNVSACITDILNNKWEEAAPKLFVFDDKSDRAMNISKELRRFYLNNKSVGPNNTVGFGHVIADSRSIFAIHRLVQLLSLYSNEPVYFYKFTFEGQHSFHTFQNNTPYGVAHLDDLFYLFNMSCHFPNISLSDSEVSILEQMTSMWTNFARTGHPMPTSETSTTNQNNTWEKYHSYEDNYFDINLQSTMKNGFFPARMHEMDKIFPCYS